jgi:hypothetical protein
MVRSGARRAIFAADLSYNITKNTCQICLQTCAFQGQITVQTLIEELVHWRDLPDTYIPILLHDVNTAFTWRPL